MDLAILNHCFFLILNGFFDYLNKTLSQFVTVFIIPIESLSVAILSFAAEFTSGFDAAGALLVADVISVKQTVIALLIGNIRAFPIRTLRHQLPRYMGIFLPKWVYTVIIKTGFQSIEYFINGKSLYNGGIR